MCCSELRHQIVAMVMRNCAQTKFLVHLATGHPGICELWYTYTTVACPVTDTPGCGLKVRLSNVLGWSRRYVALDIDCKHFILEVEPSLQLYITVETSGKDSCCCLPAWLSYTTGLICPTDLYANRVFSGNIRSATWGLIVWLVAYSLDTFTCVQCLTGWLRVRCNFASFILILSTVVPD